jgi:hypothetical protein
VKPEKRGFQPMRKFLGEKFGVVFSLTVVVTDTEPSSDSLSPAIDDAIELGSDTSRSVSKLGLSEA